MCSQPIQGNLRFPDKRTDNRNSCYKSKKAEGTVETEDSREEVQQGFGTMPAGLLCCGGKFQHANTRNGNVIVFAALVEVIFRC